MGVEFYRKAGTLLFRIETGTCMIEQIDLERREITRDTYKPWLVKKFIQHLDPSNEKEFYRGRLIIAEKLKAEIRKLPSFGNDWIPPPGPAPGPEVFLE